MNIKLANRVDRIKPSPTLAAANRAAELKSFGHPILDFTVGEPDFDTPQPIKEAAIEAIQQGYTRYTAVDGMPNLKKAISEKFARENHLRYEPSQIIVSSGAKQAIYNLFSALLNPGDEVIIPAPYWVSYPDMVLLNDANPIFILAEQNQRYKITASQLAEKINNKTRLLILNSPSNPSGMAYSKQELSELAEVLLKNPHVFVVTDDIYEHILWSHGSFANIVNACPELYNRTIVINGVSKAYAMTGWRIGYAAGPAQIINAMKKVQSQSTSNPNSIAQMATIAALSSDPNFITQMTKTFKERHDVLVKGINQIEGLNCLAGDGTFYGFVNAQQAMQNLNIETDIELCELLLNEAHVAVVAGSAFGIPKHFRISYATDLNNIQQGLLRINQALAKGTVYVK